jgi:hypothetical protein
LEIPQTKIEDLLSLFIGNQVGFLQVLIPKNKELFQARYCLWTTQDPDGSGTDELLDPILPEQFFHGIDLFRITDDLQY